MSFDSLLFYMKRVRKVQNRSWYLIHRLVVDVKHLQTVCFKYLIADVFWWCHICHFKSIFTDHNEPFRSSSWYWVKYSPLIILCWLHQMETFSALLTFCAENSPKKGQWRGALMFSFICAWTNSWANNRDTGDLRRHPAYHDVTVISSLWHFPPHQNSINEMSHLVSFAHRINVAGDCGVQTE